MRNERKSRVYDIYRIPKKERRQYQIHHIVFRSDVKKDPQLWKGFDVEKIANLYPLKITEHKRLHKMIDDMENPNK